MLDLLVDTYALSLPKDFRFRGLRLEKSENDPPNKNFDTNRCSNS